MNAIENFRLHRQRCAVEFYQQSFAIATIFQRQVRAAVAALLRCGASCQLALARGELATRPTRAEGEGFEPTNVFRRLRFSRPVQSTTLPSLRSLGFGQGTASERHFSEWNGSRTGKMETVDPRTTSGIRASERQGNATASRKSLFTEFENGSYAGNAECRGGIWRLAPLRTPYRPLNRETAARQGWSGESRQRRATHPIESYSFAGRRNLKASKVALGA